jgi:hypothetical protein
MGARNRREIGLSYRPATAAVASGLATNLDINPSICCWRVFEEILVLVFRGRIQRKKNMVYRTYAGVDYNLT